MKTTLLHIQSQWETKELYSNIYGFQIKPNTKWSIPGYSIEQVERFERDHCLILPKDFVDFLKITTGIHMNQIDIIRNIEKNQWNFSLEKPVIILPDKNLINAFRNNELFLEDGDALINIYGHRYLLCNRLKSYSNSKIYSIVDNDVIQFETNFESYLLHEFIKKTN
jgi:hypothetical protein